MQGNFSAGYAILPVNYKLAASRHGFSAASTKPESMRQLLTTSLASIILFCACNKNNSNQPPDPDTSTLKDTVIAQGLNYPWEIVWGTDNHIWMTERGGKISRINPATGVVSLTHTITEVVANGEGGLLGMALHPNFATTPHVFVAYNYTNAGNYREKIVRFTFSSGTLTSPVTILDNIIAASIHNGCRLLITPDLKLFITTGDANNTALSQTASSPNGKILRINLDGSIPADNPVAGNPYWSTGHRNPQGLVFANNILYSSEHGPSSDDEINIIDKNRNYGWPSVRGFCNESGEQSFCTANNVKEPLKAWTPTVAVCGLDYYNSNLIPEWKNSLLMVALKESRLYQLKLNASFNTITETTEYYAGKYGRMRDLCISPDGNVYICTSNGGNNDKLIEIKRE
jgi:aldose sugar dehydrogenase